MLGFVAVLAYVGGPVAAPSPDGHGGNSATSGAKGDVLRLPVPF